MKQVVLALLQPVFLFHDINVMLLLFLTADLISHKGALILTIGNVDDLELIAIKHSINGFRKPCS